MNTTFRILSVYIFSLLAALVGAGGAPPRASLGFYAVAAQVVPIIIIAVALEGQLFRLTRLRLSFHPTRGEIAQGILYALAPFLFPPQSLREREISHEVAIRVHPGIVLGGLVAAEFSALHALATNAAAEGEPRLVYAALSAGFTMLVGVGLLGRRPIADTRDETRPSGEEDQSSRGG